MRTVRLLQATNFRLRQGGTQGGNSMVKMRDVRGADDRSSHTRLPDQPCQGDLRGRQTSFGSDRCHDLDGIEVGLFIELASKRIALSATYALLTAAHAPPGGSERLVAVTAAYDPGDLFHFAQSIPTRLPAPEPSL
jgi:hypothetical protein